MVSAIFAFIGLSSLLVMLAVLLPAPPRQDPDEMRQRLRQAQMDLENL